VTFDTNGAVIGRELSATFSIDSPVGRVTGTERSTNFGIGCGPVDDHSANTLAFNTNPGGFVVTDTYDAHISTAPGQLNDNGLFQTAFSPSNFDESFSSTLASP